MKEVIDDLYTKLPTARAEVLKITDAINALQAVCTHNWKYDHEGHHKDYYKCNICRKEESR